MIDANQFNDVIDVIGPTRNGWLGIADIAGDGHDTDEKNRRAMAFVEMYL